MWMGFRYKLLNLNCNLCNALFRELNILFSVCIIIIVSGLRLVLAYIYKKKQRYSYNYFEGFNLRGKTRMVFYVIAYIIIYIDRQTDYLQTINTSQDNCKSPMSIKTLHGFKTEHIQRLYNLASNPGRPIKIRPGIYILHAW